MVPSPCPLEADAIEIHDALAVADQVQSRVASTVMDPFAPEAGALETELLAVTPHFGVVGAIVLTDVDPQAAANSAMAQTSAAVQGVAGTGGDSLHRPRRNTNTSITSSRCSDPMQR